MKRRVIICDGCTTEARHPDLPEGWSHVTRRVAVEPERRAEGGMRAIDQHFDFCSRECIRHWLDNLDELAAVAPAVCQLCFQTTGEPHLPNCPSGRVTAAE